ncbi:hypothetical protein ACFVX3_31300 [Rhodococcus erythropolis]
MTDGPVVDVGGTTSEDGAPEIGVDVDGSVLAGTEIADELTGTSPVVGSTDGSELGVCEAVELDVTVVVSGCAVDWLTSVMEIAAIAAVIAIPLTEFLLSFISTSRCR